VRVLFQIYNRRGLGHLMRGLNIGKALIGLHADARLLFHMRSAPPHGLWDARFEHIVGDTETPSSAWNAVADRFRPDVAVYDTMPPRADDVVRSCRRVFVMRRCKEERQQELFADPQVARVDRILIPHTVEEFGYDLPVHLAERSVFVGPIVREPREAVQRRLRRRYGLGDGGFLLVSTPGGGGFLEQTERFLGIVRDVHRRAIASMPALRHIVVPGPRFQGRFDAIDGMTVVGSEPDLIDLLALADLVIACAGYNTIHELRVTDAPAALLPSPRSHDDQRERAERLEQLGRALVLDDRQPELAARAIVELIGSPATLHALRRRAVATRLATGNAEAARRIAELVN